MSENGSRPAGGVWADCRVTRADGVDALYRAHAPHLLRYVRRLAADRGLSESQLDTEGVVQEAFTALLRYRGTVDNPPAWLCTVARRLVGRAHTQSRRTATGDPGAHLDADSSRWSTLSPRASLDDITHARTVVAGIAELPDRQGAATYLRHVQGWSLAEIGELLDCAPNTAGVHVHRGAARLRTPTWARPPRLATPRGPRRWPRPTGAVVLAVLAGTVGYLVISSAVGSRFMGGGAFTGEGWAFVGGMPEWAQTFFTVAIPVTLAIWVFTAARRRRRARR